MSYSPENPPVDYDTFRAWLINELRRVGDTFSAQQNYVHIRELHVEPEKPRDGMIVLADGTDWDPGSGAGFYGYYGSAWNKLG